MEKIPEHSKKRRKELARRILEDSFATEKRIVVLLFVD
jgi:hypothetical protein